MTRIDKIKNLFHNTSGTAVDPYKNLKLAYTKFVSDMKTSDFCNSPQRYLSECKMLKNLRNLAEQQGLKDELPELIKLLKTAEDKLAEWGVRIEP